MTGTVGPDTSIFKGLTDAAYTVFPTWSCILKQRYSPLLSSVLNNRPLPGTNGNWYSASGIAQEEPVEKP
jgi:hypothetical protein